MFLPNLIAKALSLASLQTSEVFAIQLEITIGGSAVCLAGSLASAVGLGSITIEHVVRSPKLEEFPLLTHLFKHSPYLNHLSDPFPNPFIKPLSSPSVTNSHSLLYTLGDIIGLVSNLPFTAADSEVGTHSSRTVEHRLSPSTRLMIVNKLVGAIKGSGVLKSSVFREIRVLSAVVPTDDPSGRSPVRSPIVSGQESSHLQPVAVGCLGVIHLLTL